MCVSTVLRRLKMLTERWSQFTRNCIGRKSLPSPLLPSPFPAASLLVFAPGWVPHWPAASPCQLSWHSSDRCNLPAGARAFVSTQPAQVRVRGSPLCFQPLLLCPDRHSLAAQQWLVGPADLQSLRRVMAHSLSAFRASTVLPPSPPPLSPSLYFPTVTCPSNHLFSPYSKQFWLCWLRVHCAANTSTLTVTSPTAPFPSCFPPSPPLLPPRLPPGAAHRPCGGVAGLQGALGERAAEEERSGHCPHMRSHDSNVRGEGGGEGWKKGGRERESEGGKKGGMDGGWWDGGMKEKERRKGGREGWRLGGRRNVGREGCGSHVLEVY